jgi:membrane protease YdiL (CAAX protease family)
VEGDAQRQSQPAAWPRPVEQPSARGHWWSIQPPPPAPKISARRAYAEVLLVFAVFFAASIVVGGEALARRYPRPSGSWALFVPAAISELGTAALAVLVVVLLSGRRGITPRALGLGWPVGSDGKPGVAQSLRIGVWAVLALLAGGLVTVALAMGNKLGQPVHQDASYLTYTIAASLTAGIVEETVVLAFVVTTLRQAARPVPEIVLVAILLRCSYHDYYGLGVIGIAVWAAVFAWLFLRSGSVLPLIAVHAAWDANIFLGQRWHVVQLASALTFLGLLGIGVISWLAGLADRRARARAGLPPHGLGVPFSDGRVGGYPRADKPTDYRSRWRAGRLSVALASLPVNGRLPTRRRAEPSPPTPRLAGRIPP